VLAIPGIPKQVAFFGLVLIPRLNFLVQVKTEAELLPASHGRYVSLFRWNVRGTQVFGECFPRGIPRQKQRRHVVEEQKKGEYRYYAERG
jgi:hypothetical protein